MKALAVFGMVLAVGATAVNAATVIYDDRATFEAALLGGFFTDDYSAAEYGVGDVSNGDPLDIHSNAHMSGVVGETDYFTTGWDNWSFILDHESGNPTYCAGCNGSFLFEFTTTSFGDADGVFGAGYDNRNPGTGYYAYITYGDNSTQNVSLNGMTFFGVTSDLSVKSIHTGLIDGGSTRAGSIQLDNLTIGIPEPAMLSLLALGGLGVLRRRR